MRMSREFDPTKMGVGSNLRRGFKINCGRCGAEHKVAVNSTSHPSGNDQEHVFAHRKFESHGWLIGKRDRDDRCPDCQVKETAEKEASTVKTPPAQPQAPVLKIVSAPANSGAPVTSNVVATIIPVREMQREDRRIIFAKIGDVYESEDTGYRGDWNDAAVARDLGVPLTWVETIREENFGPVKSNAEIIAQISAANEIMAQAAALVKAVQAAKANIQEAMKLLDVKLAPLLELMEKTERSIAALEKAVR